MLVIPQAVRITVSGKKVQHKKLIATETRQQRTSSIIQMMRNTTYLLLTEAFAGVWGGVNRSNRLRKIPEFRAFSKQLIISDRYVSDLPSSPETVSPQKPHLDSQT